MSYIGIPLEVLQSPEFMGLPLTEQKFLIDLYVVFSDCETFTLNMQRPQDYRQPQGVWMQRKIRSLLDRGFLTVIGMQKSNGHVRRVFEFAHKPVEIAEAA